MTDHKQTIIQYEEVLEGKTIRVPDLVVDWYFLDGVWEETYSCESMRRIEMATENVWPNWYHRFVDGKHDKENCKRCQEKHLDLA